MRSDDIKTPDGSSRGVKALKSYLEYAETGRLEQGEATRREPDSDFEIFVRDRLAQHGFEVVPQVGVAGYFIDLAVKHPKHSGFLLGIECDGPRPRPFARRSAHWAKVEHLSYLVDRLVCQSAT
jgi:REase_MTES_1575